MSLINPTEGAVEGGGTILAPPRLILSITTTTPPVTPTAGDAYIIPAGATGDWSSHVGDIAQWSGSAWTYLDPSESWFAYVDDEDTYYLYTGTTWETISSSSPPTLHAASHKDGGADEVATATPATGAIPKADGAGKLDSWISDATTSVKGKVELATDGEALAGVVVQGNDARLSDARTPTAHAASHKNGGADEVATTTPAAGAIPKADGTGKLPVGFIPATAPSAHATTHEDGGADQVTAEKLISASVIPSQILKKALATDALTMADLQWQPPVISFTGTPPGSPSVGDRYRLNLAPTGAWSGHPYEIAEWGIDSAWHFSQAVGFVVYDIAQDEFLYWTGSVWKVLGMYAHSLAGGEHIATTLANFNMMISDATLDDASSTRTPTAHKTTHEDGGADEISVAGLSGILADAQWVGSQVYFVGKHGSDAKDGKTHKTAKLTIGAAITAAGTPASEAVAVSIVVVDDGEYVENIALATYVNLFAPYATLKGAHTIAPGVHLEARRMINAADSPILTASGSGSSYVDVDEIASTASTANVVANSLTLYLRARRISSTGTGHGIYNSGNQVNADVHAVSTSGDALHAAAGSIHGRFESLAGANGIVCPGGGGRLFVGYLFGSTAAYNVSSGGEIWLAVGEISGSETTSGGGVANVTKAGVTAAHKASHVSGGGDAFASTDVLEAIVKRLQETAGPTTLAMGAVTDGQVLQRSGTSIVGRTPTESIIIAASDEVTEITAGTSKVTFRMPYAMTLSKVKASVTTAPTGSGITIDINEGGSTILSTKLTIDATEKTSEDAATPAVISDANLAADAEITIDFDAVGSTTGGAGVKVTLIGVRA